jgi:hypothetical protein
MKKIEDIYKEYKVMPILALHQLRVAAVAMQICDSLSVKLDTDSIIKACLLHDIANIIKFDLTYFPHAVEPEGIDYWQSVKAECIEKYGKSEHVASAKIVKDLGQSAYVSRLVDMIEPEFVKEINSGNDLGEKIGVYADNRVTPHGVVSLSERLVEVKKRYEKHPHSFNDETHESYKKDIKEIENQIFSYSKIKPNDINDKSIEIYLEKLKNYEI